VNTVGDSATRNALTATNIVNLRATYLSAGSIVDGAALDKYSFMREAYLQRRRSQVFDGDPPEEEAPGP
jgi:phospholipid-binding lipoprotein MlaA